MTNAITEKTKTLSELLKEGMKLSDDKSLITIDEKVIATAFKDSGVEMDTVNLVHAAEKQVFNASYLAAGELVAEHVAGDETLADDHMTVFHMAGMEGNSVTHSFNKDEEGGFEMYSTYEVELTGDEHKAISEHLKERLKITL